MSRTSRFGTNALSRRRFLQCGLYGATAALLAACTPKATPTPPPARPAATAVPVAKAPTAVPKAAAPVTVRVQDWAGDWQTVAAPLFTEYEAKNPNVKIAYEPYGDGWVERTMAAMVAGDAPDVIHVWDENAAQFASRGQLLNMDDMFQQAFTKDQQKDFLAYQIAGMALDGFRWGVPKHAWIGILYYNKDMFDEAKVGYPNKDWTYDEYGAAMEKLVVKDASGKPTRWGMYTPAWTFARLQPKITAWGGHVVDQQTRLTSLLHEKPAQDALEWIRARMWDKNSIAQNMQVEKKDGYDSLILGKVAMAEEGTSQIVKVAKSMKAKWDIALHPKGPAVRRAHGSCNGYSMYKGSATRGTTNAAWGVIQYMITPEFQKAMLKAESRTIVPSRKSAIPEFLAVLKKQQPGLEQVNLNLVLETVEGDYLRAPGYEMFKNDPAAQEIIGPALEKLFLVGDAKPSIFADLKDKINASQK